MKLRAVLVLVLVLVLELEQELEHWNTGTLEHWNCNFFVFTFLGFTFLVFV